MMRFVRIREHPGYMGTGRVRMSSAAYEAAEGTLLAQIVCQGDSQWSGIYRSETWITLEEARGVGIDFEEGLTPTQERAIEKMVLSILDLREGVRI
jgi:hypothetical protein